MKLPRISLLLVAGLLGGAVIGTEIWLLHRARAEVTRAQAALTRKKQERDWLARQVPAPTAETEAALVAEIADVRRRIADLRAGLQPRPTDPFAGPVAASSMDAFFQLAGLVEQARAQAGTTRVTLRAEERFGFAAYANEGPDAELLAPVHRQQQAVRLLLEPLFESRPLALLGVRRTAPGSGGRSGGEDLFTLDPNLSLRQPGLVETEPVRLEFTGQTSTLRTFLNGLAGLRSPVVVRSVEVEPLPPAGGMRPVAVEAAQPVVRQTLSRFAVTLEFILLAAVPGNPAP